MPETERPAAACPDVKRALEEGEQRSREAANPSAPGASGLVGRLPAGARAAHRAGGSRLPGAAESPFAVAAPGAPSMSAWHVALWRRHKWKLFGLLLFLLTEFCLFTWGGTPR